MGSRSRATRPPSGRAQGSPCPRVPREQRRRAPSRARRRQAARGPPDAPSRSPTERKPAKTAAVDVGQPEVGRHRPGDRQAAPGADRQHEPRSTSRRREAACDRRGRARSSRPRRQGRRLPSTPSRPRRRRRAASRSRPTPPLRASASRAKLACDTGRPCAVSAGHYKPFTCRSSGHQRCPKDSAHCARIRVGDVANDPDLDDPLPPPDDRTCALRARIGRGARAALLAAAPASAAPSCARQVIDDWYEDGRVDRTYPLHCYDDAIEALPPTCGTTRARRRTSSGRSRRACADEPAPPATTDPSPGDGTDGTKPTKPPTNQTTTERATRRTRTRPRPQAMSTPTARAPCRSRCSCSPASRCC